MKLVTKQTGILIALILGVVMLFLPAQDSSKYRFDPEKIAENITESRDQLDPRTLSEWIIEGRRDFFLVDIRDEKDFTTGSIEGAENIPLSQLLKKSTLDELPEDKMIILYSNGSSHAGQAWLVLQAAGIDAFVLEGGFNYWNKVILNPEAPQAGASDDEILLYRAKLAVKNHFGGGGVESDMSQPKQQKKKIFKRPRKKKKKLKGC
ncbi:MAG: rhodanese-like domain-containing protein [Candidatus Aminicenantes bacterium]|nr:rhodanese-like domain-containing protein [Candidatus Aminicenantes bacterium]